MVMMIVMVVVAYYSVQRVRVMITEILTRYRMTMLPFAPSGHCVLCVAFLRRLTRISRSRRRLPRFYARDVIS